MIEEKIPVVIHGQTYEILGNSADTLYYHSLARYVEEKMKEIQQSTQIVSSQKIAVLAALNVADELFQERDTKSISVKSLEGKQQELIHILDKVLEQ